MELLEHNGHIRYNKMLNSAIVEHVHGIQHVVFWETPAILAQPEGVINNHVTFTKSSRLETRT